jgi:hypothetical protein
MVADLDDDPYPPRSRGGGWSALGWMCITAVAAAGVTLSLHRNDMLRPAAQRVHQESLYSQFETKVGAPGFGTLRSLETFRAAMTSAPEAAPAPPPESDAKEKRELARMEVSDAKRSSPAVKEATPAPMPAKSEAKVEAPPAKKQEAIPSRPFAQRSKAPKAPAARAAIARPAPKRAANKPAGNSFDPLNPNL